MFLEADKLGHAESALQRAMELLEAGGYASARDTVMLHQHLAQIELRRQGWTNAAPNHSPR